MVRRPILVYCLLCVSVSLWLFSSAWGAEPLPNTKPLTEDGDLAAKMVDGIHKYLDRELAAAPEKRDTLRKAHPGEPVAAKREQLRKLLGVVDDRVKPNLQYDSGPGVSSLVGEYEGCKVHAVRWAVLPGVDAEGLLIEPNGEAKANAVAIPHADQTPEQVALGNNAPFAMDLARHGCRVLVPTLINRDNDLSANPKLNRATNLPHREFIHRMAYEMGRTLTGYEVQKVLAAVDWFTANSKLPIGVIGYGDGGPIALYAAALDDRIRVCEVAGYFRSRDAVLPDEPIDRNVWGRFIEFGDAELAHMVAPPFQDDKNGRHLILDPGGATNFEAGFFPKWDGPVVGKGRGGAAPGKLTAPTRDSVHAEVERWCGLAGVKPQWVQRIKPGTAVDTQDFLGALVGLKGETKVWRERGPLVRKIDAAARHKRQFDQLVAFTQKLWRDGDATRKQFWKKADYSSIAAYEKSTESYRDYFHTEVIGKLPESTMSLNPRTRQVYNEKTWTGYEVMLDVYPDVFAYGILLLPKNLKPGEKRPIVVCQHGLEGRPTDTINLEKRPVYNHFSRRLVELGYIVYAPQNPYIGQTSFRQIQRKAQPLKASLFSFIVRQHQRTIDWLETLPGIDPKRIAFYGLSYGGKTAMRVPAIEKRYCLSICSADFNEWVGKCVSVDLDRSYMWTIEYDMYEFDLGNTFNYAEMAYLIAPRPFMVERGHDDGVGTDEMVAYEFAKVRYLYANRLKLGERTTIEFSPGGHQIFANETFAFLKKHLDYPR